LIGKDFYIRNNLIEETAITAEMIEDNVSVIYSFLHEWKTIFPCVDSGVAVCGGMDGQFAAHTEGLQFQK